MTNEQILEWLMKYGRDWVRVVNIFMTHRDLFYVLDTYMEVGYLDSKTNEHGRDTQVKLATKAFKQLEEGT